MHFRDSESSGTRSTVEPLLGDYDERSWFGESGVPDPARDPIAQAINLLAKPDTMGNLEALISCFEYLATSSYFTGALLKPTDVI
ncbi:unnamed protein product [Toxocara canis]|uniref:Uncharacterized protein n=1 Tax=Toxocara canis TaxID=6265 RepID=A0A3P7FCS3_TOXCA|nr:unnamed protein product [Toxocara canis]